MTRPWPLVASEPVFDAGLFRVMKDRACSPRTGEDIEVVLLERREVPARIAGGEINNAMTVAALALASFGGHL